MKTTEKLRLLNDVLEDEAYCAARTEIVTRVLAEARSRRTRRTWARRALALAACVPLAAGIYFAVLRQVPSRIPEASTLTVVRSQPLAAEEIVRTTKMPAPRDTGRELLIVRTAGAEIEMVQTGRTTEELSDQQLLDLFKGRPVALVTVSARERQLIVLDSDEDPSP